MKVIILFLAIVAVLFLIHPLLAVLYIMFIALAKMLRPNWKRK